MGLKSYGVGTASYGGHTSFLSALMDAGATGGGGGAASTWVAVLCFCLCLFAVSASTTKLGKSWSVLLIIRSFSPYLVSLLFALA